MLPYIQGVTECIQRDFNKHDIMLYSKAGYAIRNAEVSPKDPIDMCDQCGVVYECGYEVCGKKYVGEMGRSLGESRGAH